jgi:hypothetical protein
MSPTPLLTRQWSLLYHYGSRTIPALAVLACLCYGYISYQLYHPSALPASLANLSSETLNYKAKLYATAAVLVISLMPFTLAMIMPTNKKLQGKTKDYKGLKVTEEVTEVGVAKEESVKQLVDKWGLLNAFRGLFPLGATILAMLATV